MQLHIDAIISVLCLIAVLVAIFGFRGQVGPNIKKIEAIDARLKEAAAREFDGAKPALIHACDALIDKVPDNMDITAMEAKALIGLTTLARRLLSGNPLLAGADLLLMSLLPLAFAALPKTVDTANYKGLLKEEVVKVIREARL
jgi:hypothetical protein